MFHKVFNPSNSKSGLDRQLEESISFNLSDENLSQDDLTGENIARTEKAEQAIWQGIHSEKKGELYNAVSYYRLAIEEDPESAKAYQLLSNVLKKMREQRQREKKQREKKNSKKIKSNKQALSKDKLFQAKKPPEIKSIESQILAKENLSDLSVEVEDKMLRKLDVTSKSITVTDSNSDSHPNFSNVDSVTISNSSANINIMDRPNQQSGKIILLPEVRTSSSGELVVQDNMGAALVYIEQALAYFEQKQWSDSIRACQEALRICPTNGKAYKVWGNCLQKSGDAAGAIGIYAKALEVQPDMAEIYCNLGNIYAKKKNWEQAIEYYQKSNKLDPENSTPYRNLARVWNQLEEYDKSAECFFQALEIEPSLLSAKNHFELATNLLKEGNTKRAISCYKYCINIDPKFTSAYVKLADALEHNGQTEAALFYYKKLTKLQGSKDDVISLSKSSQQIRGFLSSKTNKQVQEKQSKTKQLKENDSSKKPTLQLKAANQTITSIREQIAQGLQAARQNPRSPEVLANLGNLYAQTQLWQNSVSCYTKAVELAPQDITHYLNLGKAWQKAGNVLNANQAFYRGFSLQPKQIPAMKHLMLGNNLIKQEQLPQGITCYRRAIAIQPDLVEAYWQLGAVLNNQKNYQGALACYQQALKVKPELPQNYLLLGKAFSATKDSKAALKCYQKAAELAPQNAEIQHNLGEALSLSQQWERAIAAYQKAIAINPKNSWSHNNLGNALLKTHQWKNAASCFRNAIKLKADFPWSHYNLGEALYELQELDAALEAYKTAQKLEPNLPEVTQKIGSVLHQRSLKSRRQALAFCKEQIAQEPDNIELYHQAIALENKNHELYAGLGDTLAKQGKIDEAIVTYQMGLELQPKHLALMEGFNNAMALKNPSLKLQELVEDKSELTDIKPNSANNFQDADMAEYKLKLPLYESPLISIIIPVYNQIDYTFNCLKSIVKNVKSDIAFEVIIVNDCSTDSTIQVLSQVENLQRIDNPHNMGFLNSCNRGISEAKGEYIYFLNNDTELNPQALSELLKVLEQDPQVGAVGSKLIYPHGSLQEAGGVIWQDASGWNYGREDNLFAPQYNYLRPVDYCSAASLVVKTSAIVALNGFDLNFAPAYYEDTDLCFAIRHRLGLKVMYQPKSEVIHHEGISCGTELSSGIKQYQSVNLNKFKQKWAAELNHYPVNTGQAGINKAARRHLGEKVILVIDIYPPCYDKESGSRRIWELLQIFKQLNYHVIFVPDNSAKEQPYVGMLQDLEIEVVYTQDGYGTPINEQLRELLPFVDIAWVSRPQLYEKYASLIRQHDQIKLIYDTVDLHYLRLQREGQLKGNNNIEGMRQWVKMQARELKAAHEADLTITITDNEKEVLQQQQVNRLAVVPNIHKTFSQTKPGFEQRNGLLFIGSYNHPPNIDAVIWLCQEIMPLVWQEIPDLTVTLLGSNTVPEVESLGQDKRITVTGYVADVTSYFLGHRVFVAPLRYGAGMKGKIGQSLEYGLPLVSTKIGIEGMNLNHERDVLEANQTTEFAEQIIRLYKDQNLWRTLAENSESAIAPFTIEAVAKEISQILHELIQIK